MPPIFLQAIRARRMVRLIMKKPEPAPSRADRKKQPQVIGWREVIGLPDLGIDALAAKIDTGARTSALHARSQTLFEKDGVRWVRFKGPRFPGEADNWIELPVLEDRAIKNTSGIAEDRVVVRTLLRMGRRKWSVDISLADRENMGFEIILGRTAIRRHGLLVDSGRSFLLD